MLHPRFVAVAQPRLLLTMLGASLLTGCATELRSVRLTEAAVAGNQVPLQGAPYNLTFTQFEITLNRTLTGCKAGPTEPIVEVELTASITASEVRDPMREYALDFAALRAFFKTTDVSVSYHENGALKSVNAKVSDETAPVLASVLAAAGKVVLAGATGVAAPLEATELLALSDKKTERKGVGCSTDAMEALAALDKATALVASQQQALEEAVQRLKDFTATVQGLRRLDARSSSERRQLLVNLYKARDALQAANQALAQWVKVLSAPVAKAVWPVNGEDRSSKEPLFAGLGPKTIAEQWGIAEGSGVAKRIAAETTVWTQIHHPLDPENKRLACTPSACPDDAAAGIKFRMPMPGKLQLFAMDPKQKGAKEFDSKPFSISQLGPVYTLALKNWPFMTQSVSATFDEGGRPLTLGTISEAAAPKIAKALEGAVDEVQKVREGRKPQSLADQLKAQNDLLDLQKKNADLRKALNPAAATADETALKTTETQTAMINAEVALLKAREALAEALAKVPKDSD